MDAAPPLNGFTLPELSALFRGHGISTHQARLTFQAMHRHGVLDPKEMPAISSSCRAFLSAQSAIRIPQSAIEEVHRAQDGTVKLRVKTSGEAVEAVIIPNARRVTLCVSSQAGCAAGCTFCHTGTMGLLRNLQAWEIVEQVRLARAHAPAPITNIVFMGMGEPLHNEEQVLRACRILNDDVGAGFSRRHIVVSTAGVGNRLRPLWESNAASLAISLHATTDEVRSQIVPLNRQWNLAALRETLLGIPWKNRESLTVAYLLLDGVNDTRDDARRLREWCAGLPAKVNLLEFNPFPGSAFKRASPEKLAAFRQWLHDEGLFNTHRHSRGDDVMAACGQLATAGSPLRRRVSKKS
jgi:23S rRNA (adenine2503-C2)-methyltransferase